MRATHYVEYVAHEVGVIAHSCVVRAPRQAGRSHSRVVMQSDVSIALEELHPLPTVVDRALVQAASG